MNPIAQQVQDVIYSLGFSNEVIEFEKPTRTAEEAASRVNCHLNQIVKSLVFQGVQSGRGILVLTSGVNRVDTSKLEKIIGEKVKKANPEFVLESSGYSIGGIPPIGLKIDFIEFMDKDLMQCKTLWAAAGTPNAVFQVSPQDLLTMSRAVIEDIKEDK